MAFTIAKQMGIDMEEAEAMRRSFVSAYPRLWDWKHELMRKCEDNGGRVDSLVGRFRLIRDLVRQSASTKERKRAERQVVSTAVQGSAADVVKLAMIAIQHRLRRQFGVRRPSPPPGTPGTPGAGTAAALAAVATPLTCSPWPPVAVPTVRLLLQIHDELLYEVPEPLLDQVATVVREEMCMAVRLDVPLEVRLKSGCRWGSLLPLEPPGVASKANTSALATSTAQ